jgi:CheY-like chemotaxis protein
MSAAAPDNAGRYPASTPYSKRAPPPPARVPRVLLVDDSDNDRILLQAACKHAGLQVKWHSAPTAAEAIVYLKGLLQTSTPASLPDLVILDIIMPQQDGLAVLAFIRSSPVLKHLPVVIWTGHPAKAWEQQATLLGATAYYTKPHGFGHTVQKAREIYTRWLAPR